MFFRGRDSPPSLESTKYPDLLEPILKLLQLRTHSGSKTIFYKVRAHRGLTLNEIADQQAEKGYTADAWLGEVRGREMEEALLFTKLDQKGVASARKRDHLLPRRMERTDELGAVTTDRQGGTKSANFLLRPGEGREFLGKALQACSGHASSIMLKAISNIL